MEKQKAQQKHIQKLKLENGQEITIPIEILNEQRKFYKSLYTDKLDDYEFEFYKNRFLRCKKFPSLNSNDRNICEGILTDTECFKALKSFKKNKLPGNDGITYDFYEGFWQVLNAPFLDCFNYSYDHMI